MGVAEILREIEEEADAEVARIEEDASRRAAEVLASAHRRSATDASALTGSRAVEVAEERDRLLREATSRATLAVRAAREDAFEAAIDEARRRLSTAREREDYPDAVRLMTEESLRALPDGVTVRVDPRDETLARSILGPGEGVPDLDPSLDSWGGVEVVAPDGRTVLDTLEERLSRAEPWLRSLVAGAVPGMLRRAEKGG